MDNKEGVEAFCNHLVNEFGYVLLCNVWILLNITKPKHLQVRKHAVPHRSDTIQGNHSKTIVK